MIEQFNRTDEELHDQFYLLRTRLDVAKLLGVPLRFLTAVLYRDGVEKYYSSWQIKKKSGGVRTICAPHSHVYLLQQRLNRVLQSIYTPKASTQGFVRGRSVVSNAKPHVGRRFVLNVDLEDFFPSINFGRIRGLLMARPFDRPAEVATLLATLCCLENELPIGAPTSPILANMICMRMDVELQRLARRNGCWYTRYADDITISTRRPTFPTEIAVRDPAGKVTPGDALDAIVRGNGFRLNMQKIRLQGKHQRQAVTGISVNERTNVDRRFIRDVRAMLHSWDREGAEAAQRKFVTLYAKDRWPGADPQFIDVLRGKIAYIAMVRGGDDPLSGRLIVEFENLKAGRPRRHGVTLATQAAIATGGKAVRILQMSDFHFRPESSWESGPMSRALVDLLSHEEKMPDVVAVTGDIAFSAEVTQYEDALKWFRGQLLPALGIEGSRVYFVPGNHDVARSRSAGTAPALAKSVLDAEDPGGALARVLQSADDRDVFERRFKNYSDFVIRLTEDDRRSKMWWSSTVSIDDVPVALAGLCSPLLSHQDREQGRLFLGTFQVRDATQNSGQLNIAMMHHPFEYFDERDRQARRTVENWADIVLHGHTHTLDFMTVGRDDMRVLVAGAGATYQGASLQNTCHIFDIDLETRYCRIRVFKWDPRKDDWMVSMDEFPGSDTREGVVPLRPLPR